MKVNLNRPLAFLDLETTGTDVSTDRIVEIAIVKMMPDESVERHCFRVNPTIPIPEASSKIHGIYDADIVNEPTFEQLSKKIFKILFDADLAGFNSHKFDFPLLAEEFMRVGIIFNLQEKKLIDIQNIYHKMERRTLAAGYQFYCGKKLENAHSALADTEATMEIFLQQMDRYAGKEIEDERGNTSVMITGDIDQLHEFSKYHNSVDLMGRIVYDEKGKEVFNFGKFKGQAVEDVLKKEPGYYSWMMNGDFPLYTKQVLTSIKNRMSPKAESSSI
jgi:DNA polymerase III subunit epsilon